MANSDFEDTINEYCDLFEKIKLRTARDEVAIAILNEIGKDTRMEKIEKKNDTGQRSDSTPATPKQLNFLKKLGIDHYGNLSKKQASGLIEQGLNREE